MDFTATLRFTRISAFKARKVADLVRGKKAQDALVILKFMPQKASSILGNLIKSAVANAEQAESQIDIEELKIQKILVDEGPTMKRFQFRAQGRVYKIRKRTSHITLVIGE